MSPAHTFRAAQERIRAGDVRVDSPLRGPLAEVLAAAAARHEASVIAAADTWPDDPQTAAAWVEERLDQPMLDLARRIAGRTADPAPVVSPS